MRVLLVSPYDPRPRLVSGKEAAVGGVERVFAEVSERLARRGHEVTVVASSTEPGQRFENGVRTILKRRRFTVLRAPVAGLHSEVRSDAQLVHVAATYPFTTVPVLRRARRLGIPTVLDFHFEPRPSSLVGRLGARLFRRQARRAFSFADAVIVRSRAYGRSSPSLRDVPESRWRIIPNGVDTKRFTPVGRTLKGPYLLSVGRLVPYKGIHVLLEALARARLGIPLLVVGDGPERQRLERLARRLGVDARFLGHVPDASLPSLYRGATLTILPSINGQEAFGIAQIESMACGTPVVASRLPGVESVARLGGRLAEPGDPDSLARTIREAMRPGALARGAALASRIQRDFSWDAVAERLEAVYREVLDASQRRRRPASVKEVVPHANPRRDPVL